MKTLKLTDKELEDLQSATFYATLFWKNELEKDNDPLTEKVCLKYSRICKKITRLYETI